MKKQYKYPFDAMEVGDAFDVPISSTTPGALANLCHYHGKRLGRSFTYRTFSNEGVFEVSRVDNEPGEAIPLKPRRPLVKTWSQMTTAEQRALIDDTAEALKR